MNQSLQQERIRIIDYPKVAFGLGIVVAELLKPRKCAGCKKTVLTILMGLKTTNNMEPSGLYCGSCTGGA